MVRLSEIGYFKSVNFIFLVIGHTKNVADCLFNSPKQEYQKKNIFPFHELVMMLAMSDSVSVHPTNTDDFLDYDTLLDGLYRKLLGHMKQNHIFSCQGNDVLHICKSNLAEHKDKYCIQQWK